MTRYKIMSARAAMPASVISCGSYFRIGIVELEEGFDGTPKMISSRARGVARVVHTWERLHKGKTERSAYHRAMAEAKKLIAQLEEGAK